MEKDRYRSKEMRCTWYEMEIKRIRGITELKNIIYKFLEKLLRYT